jgi:hypothetical protein
MDATDLLKQMATVYAGLHSYLDQGVVVITFIDEAGRRVDRRPFCTAFQRPDRFRYQSDDESSGRLVIWQEASLAKLFWSAEPGIRSLPLALAIGSATGISGGSALTVPSLLMPSLLEGLAAPISADSPEVHPELISDVRCLRVAARQGQQPVTLWLGADDMLIRRVVQTQRFGRDQVAGLVAQLRTRLPFHSSLISELRPKRSISPEWMSSRQNTISRALRHRTRRLLEEVLEGALVPHGVAEVGDG